MDWTRGDERVQGKGWGCKDRGERRVGQEGMRGSRGRAGVARRGEEGWMRGCWGCKKGRKFVSGGESGCMHAWECNA